jgi:hypothetical protein
MDALQKERKAHGQAGEILGDFPEINPGFAVERTSSND